MRWSVPKNWVGQTCVVIAGGPSLGDIRSKVLFDFSILAETDPRPKVITVNDAWRIYPSADVFYFCDASWWNRQVAVNPWAFVGPYSFSQMIYRGFWVTGGPTTPPDHPQIHVLGMTGQRGFEEDPGYLRHGSNSGYQAIHLAAHFGAQKIVLMGFDMKIGAGGRTHWHDDSRESPGAFGKTLTQSFLPHFSSLAEPLRRRGVQVINSTPDSALTVWPYLPLKEALQS